MTNKQRIEKVTRFLQNPTATEKVYIEGNGMVLETCKGGQDE